MRTGEAIKIFNAMLKKGDSGIGIISLSLETGVDQNSLIHTLNKYPRYFCRVAGSDRYAINCNQPHKGCISEMLDMLEFQNMRALVISHLPLIGVLIVIASGLLNMIINVF